MISEHHDCVFFLDVYDMLLEMQYAPFKQCINEQPGILDSLRWRCDNRTLLMNAARRRHREVFSKLLSYPQDLSVVDHDGSTIFHHVAFSQNEEWLEEIRNKRDINPIDLKRFINTKGGTGGWTLLHYATHLNNHNLIKWLFLNGADINIPRNDGKLANELAVCDRETRRIFNANVSIM